MRFFLLTALTMCAFAANSVLNRLALRGLTIEALDFAAIRLASGALCLTLLALAFGRALPLRAKGRWAGVAALLVYMLGFSWAYLTLDAGVGALILFGGVQITMFAGALLSRERIPAQRLAGAALAFAGLVWLLWPTSAATAAGPGLLPGMSMAAAALGWGLYSLLGRRGGDPLAATAANFLLATPLAVLAALLARQGDGALPMTQSGVALALLSGAVTSGLGYALWYALLPKLGATRAGVAQLTVPVIALLGGMALLAEAPSLRFLFAAALVLGGVMLSLLGTSANPARTAPRD